MATKISEGFKYCRSCYDHLAGVVGVNMTEAMEEKRWIRKKDGRYEVTLKGWEAFKQLGISKDQFLKIKRPLTRQCPDRTERRPHLAGSLGAALLTAIAEKKWIKRKENSREWTFGTRGKEKFYQIFGTMIK